MSLTDQELDAAWAKFAAACGHLLDTGYPIMSQSNQPAVADLLAHINSRACGALGRLWMLMDREDEPIPLSGYECFGAAAND